MTDGKKTAAIKSAAIKTTAAKTTAGKTSGVKSSGVKTAAKKPPPKKPSTKKTAKAEGKTSNRAYRLEHIDDRILAKIIAKLEEMREESQHIVNTHVQSDLMPREESLDVGDDLDQASNERDREFNLIMHQRHLRRLHQIEEAFNRMDDGSYGLCEGTDETINPKRLLIMPLTKYSIEYQELQEKTLGRISLEGSFLETDESFGSDE
ncbi:MAG: TraR/DksA family transcriptional regulator [SAR324 cluster bacterium]|nr:TraR/DksA family transcriptional regulator [SAR324 cluster bacterium]